MSGPTRRPRNGRLNHPTAGGKPTAEATRAAQSPRRPKGGKAPAQAVRRTEASSDDSENARRPGIRVRPETADRIRGNQRGRADDRGRTGVHGRDLAECPPGKSNTTPETDPQTRRQPGLTNPRSNTPGPSRAARQKAARAPHPRKKKSRRRQNGKTSATSPTPTHTTPRAAKPLIPSPAAASNHPTQPASAPLTSLLTEPHNHHPLTTPANPQPPIRRAALPGWRPPPGGTPAQPPTARIPAITANQTSSQLSSTSATGRRPPPPRQLRSRRHRRGTPSPHIPIRPRSPFPNPPHSPQRHGRRRSTHPRIPRHPPRTRSPEPHGLRPSQHRRRHQNPLPKQAIATRDVSPAPIPP